MSSEKVQDRKMNIIIGILLCLVLSSAILIGFLLMRGQDKGDWNIPGVFKSGGEEHSILLEEFVVNLKSEGKAKNYLKIEMALMYENDKDENILIANTNKIRDIIISKIRTKTAEDMLDLDNALELKKEIISAINVALEATVVEDIYFTDLVIQ